MSGARLKENGYLLLRESNDKDMNMRVDHCMK